MILLSITLLIIFDIFTYRSKCLNIAKFTIFGIPNMILISYFLNDVKSFHNTNSYSLINSIISGLPLFAY